MKKLAVIILNWNGRKLLEQFIPTAVKHTSDDEVDLIVADNGSDDDSLTWLEKNHPEVKTIRLEKNYGFAEGYNRAIEATQYPFTILLNSDVEVTPGWWRPLLRFLESNPDAGACQPKIRSWRDREMFEYAGGAGGMLDRLGYPYCRGRLFDFFAHMEEIDLCCRLTAAGHPVYAVTDSVVYHVGGASLAQGNPQKTYLNFRNNLLLLHKNLPLRRGRKVLLLRRLADTLAFLMFLAKLDVPNARAVIRAHGDFRKMRRNYTRHPDNDILSSLPGARRMIIADRFLLRKKR